LSGGAGWKSPEAFEGAAEGSIISNITKLAPSDSLLAGMAEQPDDDLHIASLTVAEIRLGILERPAGKRRLVWARLMAGGKAKGRARSALDMIIAAVAEANHCVVVINNDKDFVGIDTLNPMRTGG
jgi:predicted nucleic acid-binding protein